MSDIRRAGGAAMFLATAIQRLPNRCGDERQSNSRHLHDDDACHRLGRTAGDAVMSPLDHCPRCRTELTTPTGRTPKYPHVRVQLVGEEGNAFAILARVAGAMCRAEVPDHQLKAFMTEATSADYNNLLATVIRWVKCD